MKIQRIRNQQIIPNRLNFGSENIDNVDFNAKDAYNYVNGSAERILTPDEEGKLKRAFGLMLPDDITTTKVVFTPKSPLYPCYIINIPGGGKLDEVRSLTIPIDDGVRPYKYILKNIDKLFKH